MAKAFPKHASRMLLVLALPALLPLSTWANTSKESAPPASIAALTSPLEVVEVDPPKKELEVKEKKESTLVIGRFKITLTEITCKQGTDGCSF